MHEVFPPTLRESSHVRPAGLASVRSAFRARRLLPHAGSVGSRVQRHPTLSFQSQCCGTNPCVTAVRGMG